MIRAGRSLLVAASLAACVVLGVGCSSSQTAGPGASSTASEAPTPPCGPYTPQGTRLVITAFLDSYNSGAPDITDQFIAPVPEFQWYGAPGRQVPDDPVSSDRGSLPAYFAAQHAKGDRLELKDFSYNSVQYYPALNSWAVNFGYTLIHTSGGGAAHDAPGKGVLACDSGKIAVWRIDSW